MIKPFEAADLFCGAGGTSTGMLKAAEELSLKLNLLAINHWPIAVNSHTLNHPTVRHKCESLDTIRPCEVVPGGRLRIMAASPECTHHSNASGGRPRNDQSRATAWHICRWASDLTIDNIFIENVREFQDWGPLDSRGKLLKKRKGETFKAFTQSLESMNYRVEHQVQCAADFGDPTSRRRLIILARRNGKAIVWPEHSHGKGKKPYRTARQIIDWSLKGRSIFEGRKLSPNTIRRIAAGLKKFGGQNAEPFLIMLRGTTEGHIESSAQSVDAPVPTITAGGNHITLVEPFVLGQQSGSAPRSVENPLPTVAGAGAIMLVEPFLIPTNYGERKGQKPRCHSVDLPLPTVVGSATHALVEPFLGENNVHAVDKPVPTLTTAKGGEYALIEPFLTKYYGTGGARSVDIPLDTVTTKARYLLVEPEKGQRKFDIRIRMLQPHELSSAMSFPKGYQFYGNKAEQTKQIGNAVPVELSKAHTLALLAN